LSVYHAAAVALLYGKAGVREFTDECVRDGEVCDLRKRVASVADESLDKAAAAVRIELAGGEVIEREVAHAIGSLARPLSDSDIEAKLRELAPHPDSDCRASDIIELAWSLERLDDANALLRATAQTGARPQP
jgi:2-methylcitrate dehydratase PrpD